MGRVTILLVNYSHPLGTDNIAESGIDIEQQWRATAQLIKLTYLRSLSISMFADISINLRLVIREYGL